MPSKDAEKVNEGPRFNLSDSEWVPRELRMTPVRRKESSKTKGRCIRCWRTDVESEGPCRFHPFLLEDPGPLKYSPVWLKCKNEKHTENDIGCYTRDQHFFIPL